MKKKAVLLLVFFYITCLILTADDRVKVRLPFRVFAGTRPLTDLKKEHLALFINDSRSTIDDFIKREKSIGRKPGLGRHFILSFSMMEYGSQFEKAISYFITEILRPGDSLIVLSPLNRYPVKVIADKMKMIREIAGLLRNDCFNYSQKRIAEEKHLMEKIRKMLLSYRPYSYRNPYISALNFLETFPPEFLKFKEHFLLPAVDKYHQVVDLLSSREGERWWIHFRKHEIYILLKQLNEVVRRTSSFRWQYRWQKAAINRKILKFKKQLLDMGKFPNEELLSTLLKGDICYNIVFPGGAKAKNIDINNTNSVTVGVEGILEEIAIHSGGMAIKNSKFDQALAQLKNHVDCYYDLEMSLNAGLAENNIRLELKDKKEKVKLIYKNYYNKDELLSRIGAPAVGKVKITGFSREEDIIRFSISAYTRNEDNEKNEKFGLLKVEVRLVGPQGAMIYQRQNTLRASQDQLDITLSMPLDRSGEYKISITVYDLIVNTKTSFEHEIVL
ncbi:MAG: hypothetical protein KAT34_14235 [Candidatus Aminicenantes bacterium]|nr:hypothetical protein [Candidatus Aminicenantes bacterium]